MGDGCDEGRTRRLGGGKLSRLGGASEPYVDAVDELTATGPLGRLPERDSAVIPGRTQRDYLVQP
jgi:hypothetical protein